MEYEAKQRLIARLDECLLEHAVAVSKRDGGVQIGDIYELQDLAETHYYLKVEHTFTPAEVEALLQFKDPLDVARWCKEDNAHKHSFPICELLKEINAYQRFEQTAQEKTSVKTRLGNAALKAEKSASAKEPSRSADAR